jgi:hypothetical protein
MTDQQLAVEFRKACERAPAGKKYVAMYLFGIRYARELSGRDASAIAAAAGQPSSYGSELRKAAALAPYVTIKQEA